MVATERYRRRSVDVRRLPDADLPVAVDVTQRTGVWLRRRRRPSVQLRAHQRPSAARRRLQRPAPTDQLVDGRHRAGRSAWFTHLRALRSTIHRRQPAGQTSARHLLIYLNASGEGRKPLTCR